MLTKRVSPVEIVMYREVHGSKYTGFALLLLKINSNHTVLSQ